MRDLPRVTQVVFRRAHPDAIDEGLLGWVSFLVNDLIRVDGVQVRRTGAGKFTLSYPVHKDRAGIRHRVVQPFGRQARIAIERQVLAALAQPRRRA